MAANQRTAETPKGPADSYVQPQPALIPDCPRLNGAIAVRSCLMSQNKWANASKNKRLLAGIQACQDNCGYWNLTHQEIELRAGQQRMILSRPKNSPAGRLMQEAEKLKKPAPKDEPQKQTRPRANSGKRNKPRAGTATLAGRLVIARKNLFITQKEAAELLGVSAATIGNAERGKSRPRDETLAKMATVYDKSYTWLLNGPKETETEPNPQPEAEPEAAPVKSESPGAGQEQEKPAEKAPAWVQSLTPEQHLRKQEIYVHLLEARALHKIADRSPGSDQPDVCLVLIDPEPDYLDRVLGSLGRYSKGLTKFPQNPPQIPSTSSRPVEGPDQPQGQELPPGAGR